MTEADLERLGHRGAWPRLAGVSIRANRLIPYRKKTRLVPSA